MLDAVLQDHRNLNSYHAVALRNGNNGKKDGIVENPMVWVDKDLGPLKPILEGPFPPSAVVETSTDRFQVYWKLREPADKSEIPMVGNTNKRLASYFQGDMNATDASHILRISGTYNFKYQPPFLVRVIQMNGVEYDLSDFVNSDLPEWKEEPVSKHAEGSAFGDRIKKILECRFLQHCDRDRATLPEPEWYAMISNFAKETGGRELIHSLSRGYPRYSPRETDEKILHALGAGPVPCEKIKRSWDCGKNCGVKAPAALVYKKSILTAPTATGGTFPREAIGGLAGEFAKLYSTYLESPWSFFVFNFLTCLGNVIADRVTIQSELQPEPRFYTVTVGESADDRKSESIKKTVRFFESTLETGAFRACYGVGSAEGLANRLKESPRTLLVFDELKSFVSKSAIDGAVLLPCVNSLFEDNRFHSMTKTHSIEIEDGRLSLLAASTQETFARMWSPAFLDIGFLNRLWLVKDHGERKYSIPREIPESEIRPLRQGLGELLKVFEGARKIRLPIEEEAREIFHEWYMAVEPSPFTKRLDGYGLRLMILFAVNEGESRITADIVSRVVNLLRWQHDIRRELSPIDAEGAIAKMEEQIRRVLSRGPLPKRELQRRVTYQRAGIFVWNNAIQNLQRAREVSFDPKRQIYGLIE
ncbi:MAG: DUF3987 domain-containing protein [Proteobacteria bacterium]|nr:DUF3987 domain-containing protein [Pseudomonadota bacterium]